MIKGNYNSGAINNFLETNAQINKTTPFYQGYVGSVVSRIGNLGKSIFIPSEKPTWKGLLVKAGLGLIGLYGIAQVSQEHKWSYLLNTIGKCASTGLLMTGLREGSYHAYSGLMSPQPLGENACLSQKEKYDRLMSQKNNTLARVVKLFKIFTLSCISLNCLYNYDTLGHISFLSTQAQSGVHKELNFIGNTDYRLGIFQAAVCITNLFLNFKEIQLFQQDIFIKDNPIFEMVNTVVLAIFFSQVGGLNPKARAYHECILNKANTDTQFSCANIQGRWKLIREWKDSCISILPSGKAGEKIYNEYRKTLYMSSEIDNFEAAKHLGPGIKIPSYVTNNNIYVYYARTFIKLYSPQTLIVKSLSLLKNNIENYWKSNPKLAKIDLLSSSNEKIIKPKKPSHTHPSYFQEKTNPVLAENYIDQISTSSSPIGKEIESIRIHEKKKTRSKANASKSLQKKMPIKASKLQSSTVIESPNKINREYALTRIQELRKHHPVKVVTIEHELKQAVNFLNGSIKAVDGSEFSLDWTIGKTHYSLNFEKPHGKDPTNYKGNKLDRVLSVLETCYLIGLSENSAEKYIKEYNLYNLYRLKKYISYIFLHRTAEDY